MEVISTNNPNTNPLSPSAASASNPTTPTWGHHRYSSLSLASAANSESDFSLADQSFHTCCEHFPVESVVDQPVGVQGTVPPTSILLSPSNHRVASFSCLEDVQEEVSMDIDIDNNSDTNMTEEGVPRLIPPLTAARLALSSDFGVLRRSLDVSEMITDDNSNLCKKNKKKKLANDPATTTFSSGSTSSSSCAFPMSRSFATPRLAVRTAFRSSGGGWIKSYSNSTCNSSREDIDCSMDLDDTSLNLPSSFWASLETKQKQQHKSRAAAAAVVVANKPWKLEDLADDVQMQILSFVPLKDVRSLMATNRRYRKLLFTQDAQNLWRDWCHQHQWTAFAAATPQEQQHSQQQDDKILVDDLSLPTAARPKSLDKASQSCFSHWHQQANLSLLLSMAQTQPTDIDVDQLTYYQTHTNNSSSNARGRRRRSRHRMHTIDANQKPLLQYQYVAEQEQWMVQFTGRVGQGDRCVRSNKPFPRPTLIGAGREWIVPPMPADHRHSFKNNTNAQSHLYDYASYYNQTPTAHSLLDLFCRSARAVPPPRPAWRPFVAPFFSPKDSTAVHLTPRFVSYFEVSILEPTTTTSSTSTEEGTPNNTTTTSNSSNCVAVGVATETFDWHMRMPGWDASSFGYHGDDGGIFHSSGGMLRKFGPSYGRGDVVGCGVDHVMRGIFFTLNGEFLGYGWTGLPQELLEQDLYPVVGIDTNDWIHCNFGSNEPFQYDLKSMIVKHEELVHQSLSLTAPVSRSIRSSV